MARFIQQYPEHIREYLSNHLIDAKENEYDTLKSAIIGSFNTVTKYQDREYHLGIDILVLMDCKPLTKIPNYTKPNFN